MPHTESAALRCDAVRDWWGALWGCTNADVYQIFAKPPALFNSTSLQIMPSSCGYPGLDQQTMAVE